MRTKDRSEGRSSRRSHADSYDGRKRVRSVQRSSVSSLRSRTSQTASTRTRKERSTVGSTPRMRNTQEKRQGARAQSSRKEQAAKSAVRPNTSSLGSVSLWTKDAPSKTQDRRTNTEVSPLRRILAAFIAGLHFVLGLLVKALRFCGSALLGLAKRSRPAAGAMLLLAVFILVMGTSSLLHIGKAYSGVHIGSLDVSGMTKTEIVDLLNASYVEPVANGQVSIYASEEAMQETQDAASQAQDAALAEQVAVEEAQANKQVWTASTESLGAYVPSDALADQALAIGRSDGGMLTRIASGIFGNEIPFVLSFNDEALESLASDIDATIGEPLLDYGVTIEEGYAQVSEGHDGNIIDRDTLKEKITDAFAGTGIAETSFVAETEYTKVRINEAEAQDACELINEQIANGAEFSCEDSTWSISREELGGWVSTSCVQDGNSYHLEPSFNPDVAKPALIQNIEAIDSGSSVTVTFEKSDDQVQVHVSGIDSLPMVAETVLEMSAVVFNNSAALDAVNESEESVGASSEITVTDGEPIRVSIGMGSVPDTMSFDDAKDLGIVEAISSYTTEYTSGDGTENRNYNIHLVSDRLNNSIAKVSGEWSFQDSAGECDEEHGFKAAGAIVDGEYSDAIGGGVCQVATTVFNAVYEAGYPVVERHNHSLYIASYPAGRDAAVSWPDLDLIWENDSTSDVLVQMSYTDTSVTATLYGISPGYVVTTEEGEWSEGESYETRVTINEDLGSNVVYLKTTGADGSSFWVVRTVSDAAGKVLHTDRFDSVYEAKDEVYEAGSSEAAATIQTRSE